jgi:triosephosphate isomerase
MRSKIFANWKEYKTAIEAREWLLAVGPELSENDPFEIILCAPYVYLAELVQIVRDAEYPILIGAQDVSRYAEGAYTGEVSAKMLESVGVGWSLVGHSERRGGFGDNNEVVAEKVKRCRENGIEPLVLVRDAEDLIPEGSSYFGWEPVSAIGTGAAIAPSEAAHEIEKLKGASAMTGLYGGSVDVGNVGVYLAYNNVNGVVIGSASRDPHKFIQLLNALR